MRLGRSKQQCAGTHSDDSPVQFDFRSWHTHTYTPQTDGKRTAKRTVHNRKRTSTRKRVIELTVGQRVRQQESDSDSRTVRAAFEKANAANVQERISGERKVKSPTKHSKLQSEKAKYGGMS